MERNRRNRQPQRGGFTLLELLVVMFILVTLMTLAIVSYQGVRKQANIDAAKSYIGLLRGAVDVYSMHVGYPPTEQEGLAALVSAPAGTEGKWGGPYIQDRATNRDPWGNEYQYVCPASKSCSSTSEFDIWSFGPDGRDGTEDDIGSWQ